MILDTRDLNDIFMLAIFETHQVSLEVNLVLG